MDSFLDRADVKSALHANRARMFQTQNNKVYMAMSASGDAQNATLPLLPTLLESYDVLLYAGQMDATLGPMSLHSAVKKLMTMAGAARYAQAWEAATKVTWRLQRVNGPQLEGRSPQSYDLCGMVHEVAGFLHSIDTSSTGAGAAGAAGAAHNFTVATILNAGHLAPGNQPASALDLIERFVDGTGWEAGVV
jgi:hypothetical protein